MIAPSSLTPSRAFITPVAITSAPSLTSSIPASPISFSALRPSLLVSSLLL
jgi:hypothetical protein